MTEYTMAIGKENFYIGPTDLKNDKRLEISKKDFRYPQFVTIESFDKEIKVGDKLIFEDMAIYSMVKNNTFNGIPLPDIVLLHKDGTTELVRRFGYEDFKGRLS